MWVNPTHDTHPSRPETERDEPEGGVNSNVVPRSNSRAREQNAHVLWAGVTRAATFATIVTQPSRNEAGGEARRHFRSSHKAQWPAEMELVGSRGPRASVQALGTSLGGTFVVSDEPPPVDTDLHLWIYPPFRAIGAPSALRVLARVRWINDTPGRLPRGFGVAFRATTAEGEIALHRCFSRMAKVV
ncbi:MAG: hypothetical protein KDK70_08765 [Myxococcales bacterium]|nr:hypothetical protein [Myxococcales bacterium]